MKKQLILICHSDHLISGSVKFFGELFKPEFTVFIIPYDNGMHYIDAMVKKYTEAIYVLWQTEYLAPWIISRGCKTAVFPMYDGCANAPNSYFQMLDDAYLFNFSQELHKHCTRLSLISYMINYYPEPSTDNFNQEKDNRLFYWLRRPDGEMSESNIIEYFSPYIDSFHLHDRPDAYNLNMPLSRTSDKFTSTSNWFDDKKDFSNLVSSSKYYLAPRTTEGIGMAFLEAMAMGCIVFANNNATHNQYIYHGYNGFLIDFESNDKKLIKRQIKEAFKIIQSGKPIGNNAQEFIAENREGWIEQSTKIKQMLLSLHASEAIRPYKKFEQALGYWLAVSYYKSPKLYVRLSRLAVEFSSLSVFSKKRVSLIGLCNKAWRKIINAA